MADETNNDNVASFPKKEKKKNKEVLKTNKPFALNLRTSITINFSEEEFRMLEVVSAVISGSDTLHAVKTLLIPAIESVYHHITVNNH